MLLSRFFGRREVPSIRRPLPCRRPLLEPLEGRQLLTTVTMCKMVTPAIVGQHIGTGVTAEIVGQHIGTNIVGNHIG
jgi:hypothetical protein